MPLVKKKKKYKDYLTCLFFFEVSAGFPSVKIVYTTDPTHVVPNLPFRFSDDFPVILLRYVNLIDGNLINVFLIEERYTFRPWKIESEDLSTATIRLYSDWGDLTRHES